MTIAQESASETAPPGYQFLGTQINIVSTATTTASNPLRITFTVDGALLNGDTPDTLQIFRTEGTGTPQLVPDCTNDPTTVAAPDPCIPRSSRQWSGSDAQITIVTSSASEWNIAPLPPLGVTVSDSGYSPASVAGIQGGKVDWTFSSVKLHSVTDTLGLGPSGSALFNSSPQNNGIFSYRFEAAGSYAYRSSVKGDTASSFSGSIGIPVQVSPGSGSTGHAFDVTWSPVSISGYVFDIQYSFRKAGATGWGSWQTFAKGQTITGRSFTPAKAGTYRFEARLRNAVTGKASFWSPDAFLSVHP